MLCPSNTFKSDELEVAPEVAVPIAFQFDADFGNFIAEVPVINAMKLLIAVARAASSFRHCLLGAGHVHVAAARINVIVGAE
jgi:hypothetical protein